MEVLHGDIRITLSDEEALRGLKRTRASVNRQMKEMSRQKAVMKIEASITELEKNLVRARRHLKKFNGLRAEGKLGMDADEADREFKRLNRQIVKWEGRKASKQLELAGTRAALKKLQDVQREQEKVAELTARIEDAERKLAKARDEHLQRYGRMQSQAMAMDEKRSRQARENIQREGQLRTRAERDMHAAFSRRERDERSMARVQQQALDMDAQRGLQVAKLRMEYDKANQALQRLEQTGRARRVYSPEARVEFEIKERQLFEQMAVIRAKLKAMNADPIDIPVNVKGSRIAEQILGIGNIGMRLGPFTGTLKQFTTAALILGPILTGLLGSVTALTGAIGVGLAGGIGIAGSALGGFGLVLGGVGALTVSLFRDFKNLNTLQEAYHKQVLKTGANSDKAKTKLKEFNHALGEVTPTTRAAFMSLDELQNRWRRLRKEVRPDFFEALGETITTVNTNFNVFSRETVEAFRVVTKGWNKWMRGLRGGEAQQIIFTTMNNTTDAIKELMPALGDLFTAFGRVMQSFSRWFPDLARGFGDWTGSLASATENTAKLNDGVDGLVDSFRDVTGFIGSFVRLVKEMARAAAGPGGDMLDSIAGGLDRITESIRANPEGLQKFFGDSINTTKALYNVLQPLMRLFMEFSTILRPATDALLNLIGPLADLTADLASWGPIRAALQAWATLWLFKRGTAITIGMIAAATNSLAIAMARLGKANASAALTGAGARMRGMPVVVAPGGRSAPRGGPSWVGVPPGARGAAGAAAGARGAAGVAAGAAGAARGAAVVGGVMRVLGALTTTLIGVSPPVAALGVAAIGAAIGIKRMIDSARDRREADQRAAKVLGPERAKMPSMREFQAQGPDFKALGMSGTYVPGRVEIEQWRKYRDTAVKSIMDVNNAIQQSGQIQRELVGLGSQLQNSRLMVEQAEKNYADAVKNSGKKSLEARQALQALRDARTAEAEATRQWAEVNSAAAGKMQRALTRAEGEYRRAAAAGSPFAEDLRKKLSAARDSAAAFDINVRRAKKGIDIFTGEGAQKIGALVRKFGDIPGLKRTLIQVDDQEAATKIADVVGRLAKIGMKKTVTRILADADNPKQALRELNEAFDKWAKRHPTAELRADKAKAQKTLDEANRRLDIYGARQPEALLKARDEAAAKIKKLEDQLAALDGKEATVKANVEFTLPKSFQTDASSGGGYGDGRGVPNIANAVKGFIEKNPGRMSDMFLGSAGGLGGMPIGGTGLNAFNAIASRFGLTIGSGFRPGSITSSGNLSYHAMGRARDFPGPPGAMMLFAKYMAATFGSRLKELIYTPLGFSIKNGRRTAPYAQAAHYNHVHVAMARGGRVAPGRYNKPNVLFAEEQDHPEYFISTNPRDRRRSMKLLMMASNEIGGVREHSPEFDKTAMGDGWGFSVGGKRADREQAENIFLAIRIAKQLGASTTATQALLMAIMHESGARNLSYGHSTSTGLLQVLASTGKSMGINPRDKEAVIRAFLTKGFTGKGSAMKLAMNEKLSPEVIASMVQGNATGTGVYRRELGGAMAALAAFERSSGNKGNKGGLPGDGSEPREVPTFGAKTTPGAILQAAEARLATAVATGSYRDDLKAIFGYDIVKKNQPKRRKLPPNQASGVGSTKGRGRARPQPTGPQKGLATRHVAGMIETLNTQTGDARTRLAKINTALKGKLTPTKRKELLAERETLLQTISGNKTRVRELEKQGAEAMFEQNMRRQGPGALSDIEARKSVAAGTKGLDDDMAAARAEQQYYAARIEWAKTRKDQAAQTEAQNAYNAATNEIQRITDEIRNNQFQVEEAWIGWAEGQASLTGNLNDDFAALNNALNYWNSRVSEAQGRGDTLAALSAMGNVQQYTERVETLREDMKRLPLERDRALAALTEDIQDDKRASVALRDYWKNRLDQATSAGDLAGQIEAAGNLKSLNDEIKAAEESIATQMILLSEARRDLYQQFGSNFSPVYALNTPVGAAGAAGTVVNLTVNGAEIGPDPHTWSQNVAWELQAAV